MSVAYVESSSMVHVLPANTLAMTVLCVSSITESSRVDTGLRLGAVIGKCGHSFHMVRGYSHTSSRKDDAEEGQHCLLTWIQQDSSKGLCPMCRQSMGCSTITMNRS